MDSSLLMTLTTENIADVIEFLFFMEAIVILFIHPPIFSVIRLLGSLLPQGSQMEGQARISIDFVSNALFSSKIDRIAGSIGCSLHLAALMVR